MNLKSEDKVKTNTNSKTTKIILSGCCGTMGHVIIDSTKKRNDCTIVAGIDITNDNSINFDIFNDINQMDFIADVLIDFSNPSMLTSILKYCKKNKTPLVICTTGFSPNQVNEIKKASQEIPIFYSGNMSIGINLLIELSKQAAKVLGSEFDIEIIEKHHNLKLDAPSGTALMIADQISSVLDDKTNYVYDRHSSRKARSKNEIGIHSVRCGTIVGEHEVVLAGKDEIISISHLAASKEIFATGSINAANFIKSQKPGLYNMQHLIDSN